MDVVCTSMCHLFVGKAMRSRCVGVWKEVWQTRLSLLQHPIAIGHSEQVYPVAIQGEAEQLSVIIHTSCRTGQKLRDG